MTTESIKAKTAKKPLTGRRVISWFVLFFLVVFSVNATMTWFAITTFSGVETDDAYRKGRDFNDEIARARMQNDALWQVAVDVKSAAGADVITMSFKDSSGAPLSGMDVTGTLVRPVHKGLDLPLRFADVGDGRYTIVIEAPARGKWRLQVEARIGEKPPFRLTHEIYLTP